MEFLFGPVGQIVAGLVLLITGGELLVRGAVQIAAAFRVSPLVVGLTVVAFGTSSPELAVAVKSAFAGDADIAMGNVVGSNIINILLILGLSALITPLLVSSQLIRREVPIMVFASVIVLLIGLDGQISRIDGSLLFGGLLAFIVWSIRTSRRENIQVQSELGHLSSQPGRPEQKRSALLLHVVLMVGGFVLLGLGSDWLVGGAVTIATRFGVSKLIIGLTIVAAGTSLPEVVTSVIAAWRGEREIAVGNVVGSNLFNILCVLGLTSIVSPTGIAVSPAALRFDIPVMIVVSAACLPIFLTGNLIARWEGGLFFFYYIAYTAYLVLEAAGSDSSRSLIVMMTVFVIPLTIVTLVISLYRSGSSAASTAEDEHERGGPAG